MALLLAVLAALALAASPGEVVAEVADTGMYLEPGVVVEAAAISSAVADARAAGGDLSVVVLASEPAGGAPTFAESVLDRLGGGTVLVVAPDTIGWASEGDVWSRARLDAATEAALGAGDDAGAVQAFVATLVAESAASSPGASGDGSGWTVLVVFLVVVVGAVAVLVWLGNRNTERAARRRIDEARREVAAQLDAVANDILDLDVEVATSEDDRVREHYQSASSIYAEVQEALADAEDAPVLISLSNRLDEAIWHLDAADALLDGEPVPPKPEARPAPPAPTAVPAPPVGPVPTRDLYRRPARRSRYVGPDVLDVLAAGGILGAGRRRARGGTRGGVSGGRMRGGGARRTPRMRGGGRRR